MLDIYDLYSIACASLRFENVLSLLNHNFVFTVTNVAAPNLKHFLETVGMQIQTLNVTISERNVVEFFECVQSNCPNLKHLAIKKWSHLNFSRFSSLLKRLETLQLDENVICEYTEINELLNRRFVIKPWMNQPGVCSMQLALQKLASGFSELTNLKSLKLHRCKGFTPNGFVEFLKKNTQLTELSLYALDDFKNSNADADFFDGFAPYLQAIESISIDVNTTSHIQFISRLPALRSLQLLDYSENNDRIVDRLLRKFSETNTIEELDLYHCNLSRSSYRVLSQFEKMHTLKLRKNFWVTDSDLQTLNVMHSLKKVCCFDNVILTGDGVMSLVRMAPQLTQLDCSWCFQVTNRTIYDILNLLHHQRQRPKLEILVGGRTKITESVLNVSLIFQHFFL